MESVVQYQGDRIPEPLKAAPDVFNHPPLLKMTAGRIGVDGTGWREVWGLIELPPDVRAVPVGEWFSGGMMDGWGVSRSVAGTRLPVKGEVVVLDGCRSRPDGHDQDTRT